MNIQPQALYLGGIILMGLSAGGAVVAAVAFHSSGRRLRTRLENEYGKKRR